MKIMIVGGNARSMRANRKNLISSWLSVSHEVVAIIPASEPDVALDPMFKWERVKMSRTGMNPIADLLSIWSCVRLFRQFRPDVVIGYNAKPVIYASIAARLCGVPRVASIITGLGFSFAGKSFKQRLSQLAQKWLYRLALRGNSVVFFQNLDDRDDLMRLGVIAPDTRCVHVNGSGVDLDEYPEAEQPQGQGPVFLMIARLIREKGVEVFIEAARQVRSRVPEARFVLLGPHQAQLPTAVSLGRLRTAVEEGLIEWPGGVKDVRPYIANASVVVLPSWYREGVPRSLIEALSMGRAVITTDAPGCRDTVEPGVNGVLVPPQDAVALAEAMVKLALDREQVAAMGRESRRIACAKYDVHKVNQVINEALGLV